MKKGSSILYSHVKGKNCLMTNAKYKEQETRPGKKEKKKMEWKSGIQKRRNKHKTREKKERQKERHGTLKIKANENIRLNK